MELLDYLKSLDLTARADFAKRCDTTPDYLFQIGYGTRTPKAGLAVAIDKESGGAVPCETLLPDLDWKYLKSGRKARATERAA